MDEKLINATYDLIDELKSSKLFKQVKRYQKQLKDNRESQLKIKAFNDAKARYKEAQKYSSFHPDLKRYKTDLKEAKIALFQDENVQAYKNAKKAFQAKLDNVAETLAKTISTHIDVDMVIGENEEWRLTTCKKDKV